MPGDLLLPTGPQGFDEVQYLLRGTVAAERANLEAGVNEIVAKQSLPESERAEMMRFAEGMSERFGGGAIEPFLPNPAAQPPHLPGRRRARQAPAPRDRCAFLRGLDLGHTESSHIRTRTARPASTASWNGPRGSRSWPRRTEPDKADYGQFHRVLDQLD